MKLIKGSSQSGLSEQREIRPASGDLSAGESTGGVDGLGPFTLAVIRLDITKLTLPEGDDEVDFYIQTRYNGSNWADVENLHFSNADDGNTAIKLVRIGLPQSSAVASDETDGTLADDTKLDLPLGDAVRIKTAVTGATAPTYAYSAEGWFQR